MTATNTNLDVSPQVLQTHTLLQIAAEAFLGVNREAAASTFGTGAINIDVAASMLTG
jgi:hypothetical protein